MANSLSVNIPSNLSIAAQIQASLKRINNVLQSDEDFKPGDNRKENIEGSTCIEVTGATVKIKNDILISNIFLNLNKQGLTIITGTVGSGKSSLLRLLLKDYIPCEGRLII